MNIFYTSPSPRLSAMALDDRRVNKMAVESAQILSTAFRLKGIDHPALYRSTHEHHPCVKWATARKNNMLWLMQHMKYLCIQKEIRYPLNGPHACYPLHDVFLELIHDPKLKFGEEGAEKYISAMNCTNELCKQVQPVPVAYKLYLLGKWANAWNISRKHPTWTNVNPPKFFNYELPKAIEMYKRGSFNHLTGVNNEHDS